MGKGKKKNKEDVSSNENKKNRSLTSGKKIMSFKKSLRKKSKRFKFSDPLNFSYDDVINFEITKYTKFSSQYEIDKDFKISIDEYNDLFNEIRKTEQLISQRDDKKIKVKDFFYRAIISAKPIEKILTPEEEFINNIILEHPNRENISIRKITKICNDNGFKIGKSKVHLILKNRLHYRFRKTSVKNDKLQKKNYKHMKIVFLKLLLQCIKKKYNLIFLDESHIVQKNENYRCWRKQNEIIYTKILDNKTASLMMAISKSKLINFHIKEGTNNSDDFISFIKSIVSEMSESEKQKTVIIFDNAKIHISKQSKKFLWNNNINFITTVPYCSPYNSIELHFKLLKSFMYKNYFVQLLKLLMQLNVFYQKKKIIKV